MQLLFVTAVAIAIHGGAGTISADKSTPEQNQAIQTVLTAAINSGHAVLTTGGTSLDAVTIAVSLLESSALFNAGVGAVFTYEGTHELDASIMDGRNRAAGAAAGVKHVRSPIRLARAIMEQSPHVMLAGTGAEDFARSVGLSMVSNDHFSTERRRKSWQRFRQSARTAADPNWQYGTVGAVALDQHGNLAAATSTGGMTGKRWGRIGDSPVIGAGTFADNESCAVSATGHGEYFIRYNVAADICARVAYQNVPIAKAGSAVIDRLTEVEGTGGVIAIDSQGEIAMPFNTQGMYRAAIDAQGKLSIGFYKDIFYP